MHASINWASAVLVLAGLAGCASGDDDVPPWLRDGGTGGSGFEFDGSNPDYEDSDQDGLCDVTEEVYGSDPDTFDSDADGLPDFIELIYGFVATDPGSPEGDQVARLAAVTDAELSWPIRLAADGEPSDFVGVFENIPSPYDDGSSAGSFFVSSTAVACEPPDAVRGIEPERQRFVLALGEVRLELSVQLKYSGLIDTSACTRAYPFQYFLKNDRDEVVADRFYLLIVASPDQGAPEDFCMPSLCI